MNISLIGMPASGKSTVGALLAEMLHCSFLDVDKKMEQEKKAPLQHILDELGVEEFLNYEGEIIASLTAENTVIAPGGSVIMRQAAVARLKELGKVIYLQVPETEIERRLNNLSTRGVTLAPFRSLAELYAFRCPLYAQYADITVDADGTDFALIARRCAEALR